MVKDTHAHRASIDSRFSVHGESITLPGGPVNLFFTEIQLFFHFRIFKQKTRPEAAVSCYLFPYRFIGQHGFGKFQHIGLTHMGFLFTDAQHLALALGSGQPGD